MKNQHIKIYLFSFVRIARSWDTVRCSFLKIEWGIGKSISLFEFNNDFNEKIYGRIFFIPFHKQLD